MKAMLLRGPRPVEERPLCLEEVPTPVPGPGELLLRVMACGVCHTDLHIAEGELPSHKLPLIPGHQIVGVVEGMGAGASRFHIGERVGVPWLSWACGECPFCHKGRENLCPHARFTGYDIDGGYAQYAVVSEAFALHMPPNLPHLQAAPLLCAGVIGFRALRLCEVKGGENLGLFGFGASAHIVLQVARHQGCRVYVFSRSQEHRHLAKGLGAAWMGQAGEEPPQKLHSAIVFAPAGKIVLDALNALEKGGTLALAGIYMTPIPEMDYSHIYYEKTIRSVANATREDALEFLRLAAEIPVRTQVQTFPLEKANEALRLLKHGEIQGAAVLEVK
jgi:propanol-preferring alcohol dehydrogenase